MITRGPGLAGRMLTALAVVVTVGAAPWMTARGQAQSRMTATTYRNPVFGRDFPDPMVLRENAHSYYAYGTTVGWTTGYFPILHSKDLVHWKTAGTIFKQAPSWSEGDFWAPDVIKAGKKYFAYYTGRYLSLHCVGVAVARVPTGPFSGGRRISCGDEKGTGYIDPATFIDKDGKAYLYLSVDNPQHTISVIPLKQDMQHPAGPRKELFGLTQSWEHGASFSTVEGPFVVLHGSTYYLFFSGNDWNGKYSMGYATASSPMGPFTPYAGNPILQGDSKVHGPGGGSVVTGPDGKTWMVYHAWPGAEGYDKGGIRNMRLDPIEWSGTEAKVHVTP